MMTCFSVIKECFYMFDADCDNKIEATELEYVLRLVFKEKPDKRMVHDCMQRFDVDGKFIARVCT